VSVSSAAFWHRVAPVSSGQASTIQRTREHPDTLSVGENIRQTLALAAALQRHRVLPHRTETPLQLPRIWSYGAHEFSIMC
jgi:hypothetical protein